MFGGVSRLLCWLRPNRVSCLFISVHSLRVVSQLKFTVKVNAVITLCTPTYSTHVPLIFTVKIRPTCVERVFLGVSVLGLGVCPGSMVCFPPVSVCMCVSCFVAVCACVCERLRSPSCGPLSLSLSLSALTLPTPVVPHPSSLGLADPSSTHLSSIYYLHCCEY